MISHAFFTEDDLYNPVVVLFPEEGTLNNFITAFTRMTFTKTFASTMIYVITLTLMQLFICSLAGYGFARYEFPFKKLLFGLVILTIVIPADALMLPWYTQFRNFDVFGILHLIKGSGINLIGTKAPMYIMTLFGCGFRSGLTYTYLISFSEEFQRKLRKRHPLMVWILTGFLLRLFFRYPSNHRNHVSVLYGWYVE